MHKAQVQLRDFPGAPLVSSHRTAAQHCIRLPQPGENRTRDSWRTAEPPGSFRPSDPSLRWSLLTCPRGSLPLLTPHSLPYHRVRTFSSGCTGHLRSRRSQQEPAPRGTSCLAPRSSARAPRQGTTNSDQGSPG